MTTLRIASALLLCSIAIMVAKRGRWWSNPGSLWRFALVAVPAVGLWFQLSWAWWASLAIAGVLMILDMGALSMFLAGGAHRHPERVGFVRTAGVDVLLTGTAMVLLLLHASRAALR
jgi:hypothetical protein